MWKDTAVSHRKHLWHDRLKIYDHANSLRTPRHRYTEFLDASGGVLGAELFDYTEDSLETRNFAEDKTYRNVRAQLAERLHLSVPTSGASL